MQKCDQANIFKSVQTLFALMANSASRNYNFSTNSEQNLLILHAKGEEGLPAKHAAEKQLIPRTDEFRSNCRAT